MIGIPKKLAHIWIGPRPAPDEWMNTWKIHHSEWEYTLYDNDFLHKFNFKTRKQIDEYLKRGQYAGVADLMRLEILFNFGGLIPEADSICLRPTDELFPNSGAYTVYENEFVRGKLVSPIQACAPGDPFIGKLIGLLAATSPDELDEPWISTGNLFTAQMIEKINPEITIFPSHYFIPIHFTGVAYGGSETPYALQFFSTTQNSYKKNSVLERGISYLSRMRMRHYNQKQITNAKKSTLNKHLSKYQTMPIQH